MKMSRNVLRIIFRGTAAGSCAPHAVGRKRSVHDSVRTFGVVLLALLFVFQNSGQFFAANLNSLTQSLETKTAHAAVDPAVNDYIVSVGPVTGSATSGYVYVSVFNPAASGKTAVIKRIRMTVDAAASATYQDVTLRRISAASGGAQVTASDIPHKNSASANSILEIRGASSTAITATLSGTADSRMNTVVAPGAAGAYIGRDELVFGNNENIVLQPGEGIAVYQEAAGSTNQRIRLGFSWEEVISPPAPQGQYMFSFPRVSNAGQTGWKYASFFNPATSGKTAVVTRLSIDVDANGTATSANDIYIRRITTATSGTQIAPSSVPKKHSGSADSRMDLRYAGVSATAVGTTAAKLMLITPPAVASSPIGHMELFFESTDEPLVLQPGEGVVLMSSATGSAAHVVRLSVVWDEEDSAPASQGEYVFSSGNIPGSTTANYNYVTFMNPATSGKTALVKRMAMRIDAVSTAVYVPMSIRRITAASAGTLIDPTDIPKLHSGTANSAMEIRTTGVTATLSGTIAARIMNVTTPGAAGQLYGYAEAIFGANEPLVLKPGEGIVMYQEAAGSTSFLSKLLIEWKEQASVPTAQNEFQAVAGPISGSTTSGYNYATFMNPAASGKNLIVKRMKLRIDAVSTAVYVPMTIRRITAASAGTLIAATDLTKKNTGSPNSVVEVRTTGVTATLAGDANSKILNVITPGAVPTVTTPQLSGFEDHDFSSAYDYLILRPGEGIALYQEAAGDTDLRVKLVMEWDEETTAPTNSGEYLMTVGSITGVATMGTVHTTFFNPASSGKNYVVKRIAMNVDAISSAAYATMTIKRITAASAGTLIASSSIPKKDTTTATSTAELRYGSVTATLVGTYLSRMLGRTSPAAVGQSIGSVEVVVTQGNEIVLQPGEGLALYQESAGSTNHRIQFKLMWSEMARTASLTIGATAGSMDALEPSGATSTYANSTSCTSAATCAAFTLSLNSGSVTLTSLKITETGTVDATNNLSDLALFYDTDGNYANGVTGQYGSTAAAFTAQAATVSGSLAISAGTTYYFFVRYDLAATSTYPASGETVDFQIAAKTDVTFSGNATSTGTFPVALAGSTLVTPNATSVTYGSGLSDGARSGESVTIGGYGFGVAGVGSRATCGGGTGTGCVQFVAGGNATVDPSSITSWTNTAIAFTVSPTLASNGSTTALQVTAAAQNDATPLTYYIYPNVTGLTALAANAARTYNASDTDGLAYLTGDHFGSAGAATILGQSAIQHASTGGTCTTGGFTSSTACLEVPATIVSSTYTGNIVLTRSSDSKASTWPSFGILPRITSNNPTTGAAGTTVQLLGNHFCESGTCPVSPNRSSAADNVTFGSAQALDNDFQNLTGGAGACNGSSAAWTHGEICVKVPSSASSGSASTTIISNTHTSNTKAFTVLSTVPSNPTNLQQYQSDGATVMNLGSSTASTTVVLKADISSSLAINMALQVEATSTSNSFGCSGTGACSYAVQGTVSGGGACTSCTLLNTARVTSTLPDGTYHWQARVRNTTTNEYSSWVSFGGNPEGGTDFRVDTIPPAITNIGSTAGTNSATITWSTSGELSTSQVQYNKTGTFDSNCATNNDCTTLDPTLTFGHSVGLNNLDSGTLYSYRVRSKDVVGNEGVSGTNTFTTASVTQPAKATTFHIVGIRGAVGGGSTTSTSFSVVIPESGYGIKSAFAVVTGIYASGASSKDLVIQVNSQAARTYVLPPSSTSYFKIIYAVDAANVNVDPTPNTFSLSPQANTTLYISSADFTVYYAYTP